VPYNTNMNQKEELYSAIVPFFTKLEKKIDQQTAEIISLRSRLPVKDTYRITDIAIMLGVSQATLYRKCWNLPNFGRPDIGNNPRRWMRTTVERWYSTPEADRRKQWEDMTEEQRREVMA